MSNPSKAQQAAILETKRISEKFKQQITAREKAVPAYDDLRARIYGQQLEQYPLDELVSEYESRTECIAIVVRVHGLEEVILDEFRRESIAGIYEEAGRRGERAWQDRFAKNQRIPTAEKVRFSEPPSFAARSGAAIRTHSSHSTVLASGGR